MFSRFLGKGKNANDPPAKGAEQPRGLEVVEDDPDTAWGLWDNALAQQDSRFGAGDSVDQASTQQFQDTAPMGMDAEGIPQSLDVEEMSTEQRKDDALRVVEMHHHRIASTIRNLWGYKECSVYIAKLIMNGGDGMGHARIGFNQDAAQAMMVLSDLHDTLFGLADDNSASGFSDTTMRPTGWDSLR